MTAAGGGRGEVSLISPEDVQSGGTYERLLRILAERHGPSRGCADRSLFEDLGDWRRLRFGHMPQNLRVARRPPIRPASENAIEGLVREVYEPEARRRAKWLVFAGTFPDVFEQEGTNLVT